MAKRKTKTDQKQLTNNLQKPKMSMTQIVGNLGELSCTLEDSKIYISFQEYHHPSKTISFFELVLTDTMVRQQMLGVFNTATHLFQCCFAKQQNYEVATSGIIFFLFTITLTKDSLNRYVPLQLKPIKKDKQEMLRAYAQKFNPKSLENPQEEKPEEKLKQLTAIKQQPSQHPHYPAELITPCIKNRLIPYRNQLSYKFTIDGDIMKYRNSGSDDAMISFSTAHVSSDKYQFEVTTVMKQYYFLVGVIEEESACNQSSSQCRIIAYCDCGQIWRNTQNVKYGLFALSPPPHTGSVKLIVDQRARQITFEANNGQGKTVSAKETLNHFCKQKKLCPFIEFQGRESDAEVKVSLR